MQFNQQVRVTAMKDLDKTVDIVVANKVEPEST
jgi:hypothetical protein